MTALPQGENWLDPTLGAREYLAAIIDSSDDAIIGKTLDGIVRSWNRAAERLYGYAADEMIGRPIARIIPPELPDELPAIMTRLARGEHVEHYETIRVAKDGRRVDVSVSISPIADAGGRIVGAAAIARDISERRRAERERELLLAQVREAEVRYRDLFESVADAILVADAEGRYRDANPAASELLGYARDELLQLGVADVVATDPAWARTEYARFVEAGRWRGELELRCRDGTSVPVEALATVLPSPAGPSYVSVVRDLTERKRAEERLRSLADDNARLYRESQEALRVRDEFLSIASHELRTPVTTVKGTAQMLLRALERGRLDDARLERALRALVRAGRRLTELTDDLLDVSHQRTGLFVLRPRRLDLGALAREVANRQRGLLTERHPLTVVAEDGCVVEADRYRLEHVLTNLLENAAKYSPDGGPIQVVVRPDGDGALLEVRDTGIGLPAGAAGAIFEPFGRAANAVARQIPGLGLGLHIARDVVDRHGGRIWAESAGEGHGTTLRIWLPGTPSKAASAPTSD